MLLAVEGGGFFSSSASGYSEGLALLLFSRKEERPMRVSPWGQYQLVEQEGDPDLQLASRKKRVSRGCASFICFGCASAGVDKTSPPRVGPTNQSTPLPVSCSSADQGKGCNSSNVVDESERKARPRSILKKSSTNGSIIAGESDRELDSSEELQSYASTYTERRRVRWTDSCRRELVEIREFEPSDDSSDDEYEYEGDRRCECVIQ